MGSRTSDGGGHHAEPEWRSHLDMAADKLKLAEGCGADITINIAEQDAVSMIRDLTGGYGADAIWRAPAIPPRFPGPQPVTQLDRYVEYGVFGSDVSVDWSIISDDKELDVLGAPRPYCWPAAIKMIESGVLPMDKICTTSCR